MYSIRLGECVNANDVICGSRKDPIYGENHIVSRGSGIYTEPTSDDQAARLAKRNQEVAEHFAKFGIGVTNAPVPELDVDDFFGFDSPSRKNKKSPSGPSRRIKTPRLRG